MTARKRGLGRGLDSLLPTPAPAVTAPAVVDLERLRPNRQQPRRDFDEEALAELASSIQAQGLVQPIIVTPSKDGTYTIVAGERRYRAARLAGLRAVPVVERAVAGERELLELALVENLQRADLNPVEEAEAYRALREEFQLSQQEIAATVGKSRPAVANALRLLNLPEEVQGWLRQGKLSAGQARPLLALGSAQRQRELAARAWRERLSARQIERLAAADRPTEAAKAPKRDVHDSAAEEVLTRRLQTKVEIRRRGPERGAVHIHFHSEEELMRLYERLTGADR